MNDSQRFALAVGISLLAHVAIFALLPKPSHSLLPPGGPAPPMTVRLVSPEAAAELAAPAEPQPPPPTPTPAKPAPPKVSAPTVMARRGEPKVEAPPTLQAPPPPPEPSVAAPAMDMLAMLEARRERRRAVEEAWRQRQPPPVAQPDAATRNLQTLTGRDGVSGVFTILRKGTRTGEFAFNGWRQDARGQWREVFEVDAGQGGNLELAMVRKMIALIRTHYTGDFNWESHRLHRVIVLSARTEDNVGLEEFLMREFFGSQVLKPPSLP